MPRSRQMRRQGPSKIGEAVMNVAKPIARTIKFAGEKAISGYLGATNKLANKIQSKLPPMKNTAQPSKKPRRR